MGFADNVFDQKRGRRESNPGGSGNNTLPGVTPITGKKRTISATGDRGPETPLRKIELPTPEPDFSNPSRMVLSRESSELVLDAFGSINGNLPTLLPSLKTFADGHDFILSPTDERHPRVSTSPGIASLASTAVSNGRVPSNFQLVQNNTLPPMLGHTAQNGMFVPHHGSNGVLSTPSTGPSTSPTKSMPPNDIKAPTAALDASIVELETQLRNLKKYEEEFIALNLEDSRKMLATEVAELEEKLKAKRREKTLALIESLKREGFGGLAAVVGKEVGLGIDGTGQRPV